MPKRQWRRRAGVILFLIPLTASLGPLQRDQVAVAQEQAPGADLPNSTAPSSTDAETLFDRYVTRGGWVTIAILIPMSVASF